MVTIIRTLLLAFEVVWGLGASVGLVVGIINLNVKTIAISFAVLVLAGLMLSTHFPEHQ